MKKVLFVTLFCCAFGNLIAQTQAPINTDTTATTIKAKKNNIHWIFAGVGLGLTGYGLIEKQKANNIYNEQYLSQISRSASNPFYDEANNTRKKGDYLIYAGAAVLLTDAIFLIVKKRKSKKNAATAEKLSFQSSYTPAEGIQAGLKIRFGI